MTNDQRVGVLPIQLAVATASPGAWRDAIVAGATPGGLRLMMLDGDGDGDVIEVACSASSTDAPVGTPVAIHRVAELLAVGSARYSARSV